MSPRLARRARANSARATRRAADRAGAYFVPDPLGLVVEPDELLLGDELSVDELDEELPLGLVVLDGGVEVDGGIEVDGAGAEGGDADGVRSAGRSPTLSVRDSLQAVSSPALSARAQRPASILFITEASSCGLTRSSPQDCNAHALYPRVLTGVIDNHSNAGTPPTDKETDVMKLESSYEVPAPRQKVWEAFLDPKQLKKAIPGCEKLEAIGPDEYKATMKVGVGGVKGTFEGKVRLSDKKAPDSYKMAVEGSGGPGFIRGEAVITLSDAPAGTRVAYSADLQVGGLIASVGQRMLGGVSKMMADKFFNSMSQQLS